MPQPRTVVVTGATGGQGGAVAQALLARGHRVVAMTRAPDSAAARKLAATGAAVVAGDFGAPESLVAALDGADTLYAMGTPFGTGVEAETLQGVALIDAARQAGIGHIIYSSVASADLATGIPHFDSKFAVERHLAATGGGWTVSAPVAFMDGFAGPPFAGGLSQGELHMPLPGSRPLQLVALADIGSFVAALVERREAVFGRRIEIAGDEQTGEQLAAILSRVTGAAIRHVGFPPAVLRPQSEDLALMFEWLDRVGYSVDRPALVREFPEVPWTSFAAWAGQQDWPRLLQAA